MLKFYAYSGCSSCRTARKWLDGKGISYQEIAIRERPPSKVELKGMLQFQGGELRRLFNTSGQDYRAMGMKERLPTMSSEEALGLLATHGNLIKRPFIIDAKQGLGLVGFKEDDWSAAFKGWK